MEERLEKSHPNWCKMYANLRTENRMCARIKCTFGKSPFSEEHIVAALDEEKKEVRMLLEAACSLLWKAMPFFAAPAIRKPHRIFQTNHKGRKMEKSSKNVLAKSRCTIRIFRSLEFTIWRCFCRRFENVIHCRMADTHAAARKDPCLAASSLRNGLVDTFTWACLRMRRPK